jgi:hypothetical protein
MSRNVHFLVLADGSQQAVQGRVALEDHTTNTTQKRLRILGDDEIQALYRRPRFTDDERLEYFELSPTEKATLEQLDSMKSRIYFILQLGYFKSHHLFFVFDMPDVEEDARYVQSQYFPDFQLDDLDITKMTRWRQQSLILGLFRYRTCERIGISNGILLPFPPAHNPANTSGHPRVARQRCWLSQEASGPLSPRSKVWRGFARSRHAIRMGYNRASGGSRGEGLGGPVGEAERGKMVIPTDPYEPPSRRLDALYDHETQHVFQYTLSGIFFFISPLILGFYLWDLVLHKGQTNSWFERNAGANSGEVYKTLVEVEEDEVWAGEPTLVVGVTDVAVGGAPQSITFTIGPSVPTGLSSPVPAGVSRGDKTRDFSGRV